MKRLGVLMLAMAMLAQFGCEPAAPEEIAAAPAYDIQAQLEKAEQLFLEGNYEEVILTLDTVLEIEPANVQGYLRLSDAYIARGESYKALELLKRGLELTGDKQITARIQGMTEEIDGIVDVAAAVNRTAMVDAAGNVYWCGEQRRYFSFGYSSSTLLEQRTIPTKVDGLPPMKWVSSRSAYSSVGAGITESGDLYIWGDNCGDIIGRHGENGPLQIWSGVSKALNMGSLFLFVLKEDGSVYTRGANFDGILGVGEEYVDVFGTEGVTNTQSNYSNYQDWLHVMDRVRDIEYTNWDYQQGEKYGEICLAVTEENQLYGWGFFGAEERDGDIYKRVYSRPKLLLENVRDADITGNGELFFVTMDGKLQHVFIGDIEKKPEPKTMPISGSVIISVECGDDYVCALDTAGILYTSGGNQDGQLGVEEERESATYEEVFTPLGDAYVRQVAAGLNHTCVILGDSTLLTWGNNEYGQLGNGRMGKQRTAEQPTKVLERIKSVFALYSDRAHALSEDNTLYQSGEETGHVFAPVAKNIRMASGNVVVMEDGTLKWLNGQEVLAQDAVFVHLATEALFYIDAGGQLWGRSQNYSGELGIGSRNDPLDPQSPQEMLENFVPIMENVKKCSSGSNIFLYSNTINIGGKMTIILCQNGDVYQCGVDPNTLEYVTTPQKIASGMRDIAVTYWTVYMISEEDALYVWGDSRWDYIDEGGQPSHTLQVPKKIFEGAQKICSELLLDKEGNVYTFGLETFAQIVGQDTQEWSPGLGVSQNQLICKQVELPGKAKDIASSSAGSYFAVLENGDLYAWGNNQYGQLGLGEAGSEENIFEVKLPS